MEPWMGHWLKDQLNSGGKCSQSDVDAIISDARELLASAPHDPVAMATIVHHATLAERERIATISRVAPAGQEAARDSAIADGLSAQDFALRMVNAKVARAELGGSRWNVPVAEPVEEQRRM